MSCSPSPGCLQAAVTSSGPSLYPPPPSQSTGALLSVAGQTLTRGLAPHGPFPGTPAQVVQGLESVPSAGVIGMSKGPALHPPTSRPRSIRGCTYNISNVSGRRGRKKPWTRDCTIILMCLCKINRLSQACSGDTIPVPSFRGKPGRLRATQNSSWNSMAV